MVLAVPSRRIGADGPATGVLALGSILGDLPDSGTDPDRGTDLERLVLDLAAMQQAGLIRQWGVNNWSATSIQALIDAAAAHGVAGPAMVQLKYSVARRSVADGAPFARIFAQGVTLEASDVLEGGVLLGKSGRDVGRDPGQVRQRVLGSVAALRSLSDQLGATPAQLCVAFTLTHPALTTTLVRCDQHRAAQGEHRRGRPGHPGGRGAIAGTRHPTVGRQGCGGSGRAVTPPPVLI
jgi:diketogulonate reductase-like aldo/keto reductase